MLKMFLAILAGFIASMLLGLIGTALVGAAGAVVGLCGGILLTFAVMGYYVGR